MEGEGERGEKGRNDGKEFSQKYGDRVTEAVVSDDAINGECVACFDPDSDPSVQQRV